MSDDDKVVTLPIRSKSGNERMLTPAKLGACQHLSFTVDHKLALVACDQCGEKLDPMFVLRRLCDAESQWHQSRARYRDEMKRLGERSRTKCQHCGQMTRITER